MVEDVRLAAACDLDRERWFSKTDNRETVLAQDYPDALFFDDALQMFDSGAIQAVIVETPASQHVDFCVNALKRDLCVYGEIPPVDNLHEAMRLWEAEKNTRALFMTGANPNSWGFVRGLKDFADAGLLGEPFYLEAEYIHDCRDLWKVSP